MEWVDLNRLTSPLDPDQLQAVTSALAGLSPTQAAWVSGYLAGAAVRTPAGETGTAAQAPAPAPALTVLYGSQTGNAQGVAEGLGEQLREAGVAVRVQSMGDYGPRGLAKERLVLIVVSTHGDGEPPESAQALHRFLFSERAPRLAELRYAVLGLGDSSYAEFCRAAVDFDRRLAELGAERMLPLRCCDVDYATEVADWTPAALERLAEQAPAAAARPPAAGALVGMPQPGPRAPARDHPYAAELLENRRITMLDAIADVRHLALGREASALRFEPGDALGVWCRNAPALVDAILERLELPGDAPVTAPAAAGEGAAELGLRQALLERCELTQLHPTLVRAWAQQAPCAGLAERIAEGAALRAYAAEGQFLDLIREYPAQPSAAELMAMLLPLRPRLYSISSSPAESDDELHLTVAVVRYHAHGGERLGAASGHLGERLEPGAALPVYVAENTGFRLPADPDAPIVMIGAGTGIAPFRAFLQHRAARGDRGRNWLLFGNRHFHRDFLYQRDWQAWRRAGLLHRVELAFSRDRRDPGGDKTYVQHRLRACGAEIRRWLDDGAHLYVCGATAMGQAVDAALGELLAGERAPDPAAAAAALDDLRQTARYHRDLY